MELRTHDFLSIAADSEFPQGDLPPWVMENLSRTRTVVVRRATAPGGWVSIGIRGKARHERYGSLLRIEDVTLHCTPESLATVDWRQFTRTPRCFPVWRALESVSEFAEKERLVWGPVGSVGYQLATGIDAVTIASDLDIVVRFTIPPNRGLLEEFHKANRVNEVRIDVTLEGPPGAVSLEEYLRRPYRSLIKTNKGPRLGAFVW